MTDDMVHEQIYDEFQNLDLNFKSANGLFTTHYRTKGYKETRNKTVDRYGIVPLGLEKSVGPPSEVAVTYPS